MKYRNGKRTPEYQCWLDIKKRCFNKRNNRYHRYGGRGIKICDRWIKFENFLEDMGERPSNDHSIDRIDNDGDYFAENCKWSTNKEQMRNYSKNLNIEIDGVTRCLVEWSEHYGFDYNTVGQRIRNGWTEEEAIFGRKSK